MLQRILALNIGLIRCRKPRHAELVIRNGRAERAVWNPLPPRCVELARRLAGAESTIWSVGLGDDVAMFYTEGRGPQLIHAPRLGSGLDENSLTVGPDVALVLYPDLIEAATRQRLDAAGFKVVERFDGWLDWGLGDVVVLQRPK